MRLHQGALSFEIWFGRKAPLDVMRAALQLRAGSLTPPGLRILWRESVLRLGMTAENGREPRGGSATRPT